MMSFMNKIKLFYYEAVTSIIKWGFIFIVAAIYRISTFDILLLFVLSFVDILIPITFQSDFIKWMCTFAIWYFLVPLMKENIVNEFSVINLFKIIAIVIIIIITQFFEWITYRVIVEYED